MDGFIETTSFTYATGTVALADIIPASTAGAVVPVTIHVRNGSAIGALNTVIRISITSDTIHLPTSTAYPSNAVVEELVDVTGLATTYLYPTSSLSGAPPYRALIGGFSDAVGFTVPDSGGDIIVDMTGPLVQRGLVGASSENIDPGSRTAVSHTTPTTLRETLEDLYWRIAHP